ncbi:hypothetical protein [Halorussus lipolyticus]|uniref:hypothetical protein n=1 Tax=Halorussus lipolyticus TaxID=3034024 RepID=UPI0023E8F160|nr:hypothetical protein [Halorussus sp. DT80]
MATRDAAGESPSEDAPRETDESSESETQPVSSDCERVTDEDVERLFGSLPRVRVSRLPDGGGGA